VYVLQILAKQNPILCADSHEILKSRTVVMIYMCDAVSLYKHVLTGDIHSYSTLSYISNSSDELKQIFSSTPT
jgi:hypothetical protein